MKLKKNKLYLYYRTLKYLSRYAKNEYINFDNFNCRCSKRENDWLRSTHHDIMYIIIWFYIPLMLIGTLISSALNSPDTNATLLFYGGYILLIYPFIKIHRDALYKYTAGCTKRRLKTFLLFLVPHFIQMIEIDNTSKESSVNLQGNLLYVLFIITLIYIFIFVGAFQNLDKFVINSSFGILLGIIIWAIIRNIIYYFMKLSNEDYYKIKFRRWYAN